MKRFIYILSCLFFLALSTRADLNTQFYSTSAYSTSRTSQPLVVGHFQTTVQALDASGCAYAPGQVPAGNASGPQHLRRVSHDDDEDDPYMPSQVVPIGENAELCFLLLVAAYFGLKIRKNRKKASL